MNNRAADGLNDPLESGRAVSMNMGPGVRDAQVYANEVFLVVAVLLVECVLAGCVTDFFPFGSLSLLFFPLILQGMSPDGNRLDGATKDLLNAAASLEPKDCRDLALGDMRIKNKIREVWSCLYSSYKNTTKK